MDGINILLFIVAVLGIVFGACGFIIPRAQAKGLNIPAALDAAKIGIAGADQITNVLDVVFPGNAVVNIVDKVIGYAKTGVAKAEQLYIIQQIEKGERKAEAVKFIYDALALAEIEITPAIEKIVDGSVEAAVLALGHDKDTPAASPP